MECKVEKTQNANEVKIKIKIEAQKFEEAITKVYFQNAKYFNVPGFRKGKAPQHIVERYYGKEIFYEDACNSLLPEAYEQALEETKIQAVSKPEVNVTTIEKGKDLELEIIVATKPEVKINKYKGIEIPKIEYTVKDEDVENELKKMQEQNARYITIEDRAVKEKDTVKIDFEGFLGEEAFDGGKGENYDLEIGSGAFIPGFEEQLIGMKIDEERDVNVTFPEEYYEKSLAGKEATFKVKLHGIKEKEIPEIDDEFAKDVSEFDTIKELKADIKAKLEKTNKEKEDEEKENAVVNALCQNMEIDIPKGMIELEIENMYKEFERQLASQGIDKDRYLKIIGQTEEDVKERYKPNAEYSIKSRLGLEEVVKLEKIEASEEEIKEKLEEMAKNYKQEVDELEKNEKLKEYITEGIKNEKAIKMLIENAKIIEKENKKEKTEEKEVKEVKKEKKSKK